jgi:ribosomal protein L11 methyltransferase
MAHYKPLQAGKNLWICPSWIAPPAPEAVNVILDPGLAFGTGDHPTTVLCLEWLAEQNLQGQDLIDYGCGSGILSIAALKLGARAALGVDIDEQALEVSRRNAILNGVSDRFQTFLPAALPADAGADIVVANILARPLVELAPGIMARVRPGGWLALSGLLREQAETVRPHYARQFALEVRHRGEWVLLAGRKIA